MMSQDRVKVGAPGCGAKSFGSWKCGVWRELDRSTHPALSMMDLRCVSNREGDIEQSAGSRSGAPRSGYEERREIPSLVLVKLWVICSGFR